MFISMLTAVGIVAGLTLVLTTLLIVASRTLHVDEDRRLTDVAKMLPQNNCGACGFPSCHAFAEALVEGKALPSGCTVSSDADQERIAAYLQVTKGTQIRRVARLACAGGDNVAVNQAVYSGWQTCSAANQVAGGGKACLWGCLGLGDCAKACTFDAIQMSENGLPLVDEDRCTACGDCVISCPKDLFSLQPVNQHLWVACRNQEQGDDLLHSCKVGCTACGRCAMDAPEGLIAMRGNLPAIHYGKVENFSESEANRQAIERCPTGAIVWLDDVDGPKLGAAARPIVRHSPLPVKES